MKMRSDYYTSLTRLLFVEEGPNLERDFAAFMVPFGKTIQDLLSISSPELFAQSEVKVIL